MKEIIKLCDCGAMPTVFYHPNSVFRLRDIFCNTCVTGGPMRMSTEKAIEQWNSGRRVMIKGRDVSEVKS